MLKMEGCSENSEILKQALQKCSVSNVRNIVLNLTLQKKNLKRKIFPVSVLKWVEICQEKVYNETVLLS